LSDRWIAFTRRPVKDKGALMQTLHLRFRDLRAILLGGTPSRWPTPSLPQASTWKGALPLPNLPRPTLAVGAHPKTSHQRPDQCPTVGAGLTMASPFREPCVCEDVGANGHTIPDTSLVCWSQTAENNPHPLREPNGPPDHLQEARLPHHTAGQAVGCSLQAPFSKVRCTPSTGLSFPLRPQRCGVRAYGKKTADRAANVGALAGVSSGASGQRLRLNRGGR
jgi:hypothetical protein